MSEKPYLIGVDVGTYSAKGVLVRHGGEIVARHSVEYELSIPSPGLAEHDADEIWWRSLCEITRALLRESRIDPKSVAAIGCSAIGPTMLPVDRDGRPLRPAILYGIDTRSWREVEELSESMGPETIFASTGKPLTTQSNGPKILWFRRNQPELFEKTDKILTANGYLVLKLTGAQTLDIYSAAAFDPMFDIPTLGWDLARVEQICSIDQLPELRRPTEVVGEVHRAASEETGLAVGTPVIAGTIDAAAEAVSVGVTEPGETMLMYGTTLFIINVTDGWLSHRRMWSSPYLTEGRYVMTGGLATSAALTRWFRDQFGQVELEQERAGGVTAYQALAQQVETVPPGSNGLVALPYFSGERTPVNDPKARGVIAGLTLSHTRADVYRALLEGVAYALRHNMETMNEAGADLTRLVAVGGGTLNKAWLQIISDCLGQPQRVPRQTVGASYGDAYLAGYGVGIFPDFTELRESWVQWDRVIEPSRDRHERYNEYYPIYRRTYERLADELHALADLQATEAAMAPPPVANGG
ncbi:MAG: FGGY-family carbohydrate kinase [Trueperaceae bacterium]